MGGRGARYGISENGNKYGSQYHTLYQVGNIKFVTKNSRQSETLTDTMTKNRVYVTVGGNDLLKITYFDNENKRNKTIDLDHYHNKKKPHVHHGYNHNENDPEKGYTNLTPKEKRMVDRVTKAWYNRKNGR